MKISLQISTLLIMSLFVFGTAQNTLLEAKNDVCNGVKFDNYLLSPAELARERDFSSNSFFSNYTTLFDFYNNTSSSTFLKLVNWQVGLYLTLVVLLFITFILMFIVCCKNWSCSSRTKNLFFWIFVIFFVIFIALFITMIVFLSIGQSRYDRARCAAYQAPTTLLYGSPNIYHGNEFIGYQNFITLLTNYKAEAGNLSTKTSDLNTIVGSNLSSFTQTSIDNTLAFWKNYQSSVITNNVVTYKPDVIIKSEKGISVQIESEFGGHDQVAREIIQSASEAKFMGNAAYLTQTQTGLDTLASNMTTNFKNLEQLGKNFRDEEGQSNAYLRAGFWTFFCVGIIIIVLLVLAIIVYCSISRNGERTGCCGLRCLQTLLIFAAFFAVIFGICVLILMAGLAVTGSFCRFTGELNQGGWEATNIFKKYLNETDARFIDNCLLKNSTGYLPSLVNAPAYVQNSYGRLINLLEGIKAYDNLSASTISFTNFTSRAVQGQKDEWASLQLGYISDNKAVFNQFINFNTTNQCDDTKTYALTQNVCNAFNIPKCQGIRELTSYTAPTCVNVPGDQINNFNSLKTYINSEANLLSKIGTDFLNSRIESSYQTSINNFKVIQPNVNSLKGALPLTVQSTLGFNGSIKQITQCSNIQVDFVQFERYGCFPYVRPLYILFCLAAFATLALFILLWALFIALACLDSERRDQNVIAKDDFVAVSEQELAPKY